MTQILHLLLIVLGPILLWICILLSSRRLWVQIVFFLAAIVFLVYLETLWIKPVDWEGLFLMAYAALNFWVGSFSFAILCLRPQRTTRARIGMTASVIALLAPLFVLIVFYWLPKIQHDIARRRYLQSHAVHQ